MLKRVGKYILEKRFQKGTYGVCYKAKDDKDNKYAIKRIEKDNKEYIQNINNEIYILKAMKSKYSVEFIECIENEEYNYIVMELCDGDLNYLLKKKNGNIDILTIIKIITQLNEAFKLMQEKKKNIEI